MKTEREKWEEINKSDSDFIFGFFIGLSILLGTAVIILVTK